MRAADDLVEFGHDQQMKTCAFAQLEGAATCSCTGTGCGKDDMAGAGALGDISDLIPAAQHGIASNFAPDLAPVVVEHADHLPGRAAFEFAQQPACAVSRAHHQNRLALLAQQVELAMLFPPAINNAPAAHEQNEQQRIEKVEHPRNTQAMAPQQESHRHDQCRDANRGHNALDVIHRGIAPDASIKTEPDKTDELNDHHDWKAGKQRFARLARHGEVVAGNEGDRPGSRGDQHVIGDGDQIPWDEANSGHCFGVLCVASSAWPCETADCRRFQDR